MLLKILVFTFLSALSVGALAACPKYIKLHGLLDMKTNTLKEIEFSDEQESLCGTLPIPLNANLLISISKGKQKFETKIYRSFEGFWDQKNSKDKTWRGGTFEQKEIEITSFIPDWYRGSNLKLIDLSTNKVLTETKLK